MASGLPPPPVKAADGSFAWVSWYNSLYKLLSTTGSVSWDLVGKAGSSIADLQNKAHSLLSSLQGGTSGEYYHLTAAEHTYVVAAAGGGGGTGTVTSVDITTTPANLTVSGGPITTSGSIALDLATTSVVAGTYGSSTLVPVLTVDAYGRLTGVTNTAVSGGGSASWTEVEIDFGSRPVYDASFTITDASIAPTSKVVLVASGKPATGRTADDWQWDSGSFAANPATGSATCYAQFSPGPIVGKRNLQYQIG